VSTRHELRDRNCNQMAEIAAWCLMLFFGILLCALATGCTSIESPDGWKYKNFIFQKRISGLEFTTTNGASLRIKAASSNAEALVEAAARGAAQGVK